MLDTTRIKIDAALTNLSQKFTNNNMIAEIVAKVIQVQKDSGKYFIYGKQSFKAVNAQRRDGSKSTEVHQKFETANYSCDEYALSDIVTDKVRRNADQVIKPDIDTTELITDLIMLNLEKKVATPMTTAANYTNSNTSTLSGTSQWSDYANSTPLTNIKTAKSSIRKLIGREATSIILSGDVAETLSLHPDIKDLRKYTDPNLLTSAGLPPKILGLDVIEAKATEDTAYEGSTAVMSYVWGKNAIILYLPPTVGIKSLAPWVIFRENGFRYTSKWRDDSRKGDMIEVGDSFDVKEIADECAYLLSAVIA